MSEFRTLTAPLIWDDKDIHVSGLRTENAQLSISQRSSPNYGAQPLQSYNNEAQEVNVYRKQLL